jgi:hypothetical protein
LAEAWPPEATKGSPEYSRRADVQKAKAGGRTLAK